MKSEAPTGYDEIGESMARLVIEGLKTRTWVSEVVSVLGYHAKHVQAWVRHYEKIHADEIDRQQRVAKRKRAKIEEKLTKSDEIVLNQDLAS
jgi:hypothetical protein